MDYFGRDVSRKRTEPSLYYKKLYDTWLVVGWASSILDEPVAVQLLEQRLVVWRDADGQVHGAYDQCPHRGTQLSLGTVDDSGCITCPYHGWAFATDGQCVSIPQMAIDTAIPKRVHLDMVGCVEKYGMIWVCLGHPIDEIPEFSVYKDSDMRHVECAPYTWNCSPERMVENFMDFGHLGYLHDGLLGSRDDLEVPAHKVITNGNQMTCELTMSVPSTNDSFGVTRLQGDRGKQTNSYIVSAPYTIYLESRYHDSGSARFLYFSVQPLSMEKCIGYCYQSRDFDLDAPDEPFAEFQLVLAEQDRPIVESQFPIEAPLVLTDEVHLPFDKVAISYRRLLKDYFS